VREAQANTSESGIEAQANTSESGIEAQVEAVNVNLSHSPVGCRG